MSSKEMLSSANVTLLCAMGPPDTAGPHAASIVTRDPMIEGNKRVRVVGCCSMKVSGRDLPNLRSSREGSSEGSASLRRLTEEPHANARMPPVIALLGAKKRPEELDDLELLRAASSDDVTSAAAAAALFKRFHDPVLGFLSRLVGRDDAELDDLVQATFLSALDAAPRFEGRSQVKTWLLGIAANKARTHRRGAGRRRTALAAVPVDGEGMAAKPPSPSDGVKREQLRERLADAIERLSAKEREAFLLCDVEGVGGGAAAETLGVPQGTMWRRLHDARAKLRKSLEGDR